MPLKPPIKVHFSSVYLDGNDLRKQWYYSPLQRYTYRVLQTNQMKLTLLCVWTERVVLGRAKIALKFKCEI